MIIIVDERPDVSDAYRSSLSREGISSASFTPGDFDSWFHSTSGPDLAAVEAFVLGDFGQREAVTRAIKSRSEIPAIALNETTGLEATLKLFAAGADDVLRKPVHAREIIARIGAIRRRIAAATRYLDIEGLRIFGDGRDPEIHGQIFSLPRRERRIIEQFAAEATKVIKPHTEEGESFAIVTAPEARPYVRMIVDRLFPNLPVLSHIEIARTVRIEVIGSIS